MRKTRNGMQRLGKACREAAPETIVVFTPHGVTIPGFVSVAYTITAKGVLDGARGARVCADFTVDRILAQALCNEAATLDVPVAPFTCDAPVRDVLDMDWGAFVPLWFLGAQWPNRPRVVLVCPSRDLPHDTLIAFGRAVARAAEQSKSRVAVICSADLGHGHDATGPYGFAVESAEYDSRFCKTVRENALGRLPRWDAAWVERAMTDSYWPALMLHGCTEVVPMRSELLSYQAPTYFGMACAEYRRV